MSQRNLYKVIVLGDSAVGKTSIIHSFVDQKFLSSYKATIGADMLEAQVNVDGKIVNLFILDTAGQEKFRSMGEAFYRGVHCCVLVYDITCKKSFNNVQSWLAEFMEKGSPEQPEAFPFILVGNKVDKEQDRQVEECQVDEFLRRHPKMVHLKTSAKNREGVEIVFMAMAKAATQYKKQEIFIPIEVKSTSLKNSKNAKNKKKVCC